MVEKSFVNLLRAQRVDQPDLQRIAEATPRDMLAQFIEEVIIGADGGPAVLWGFEQVASGAAVEFTRGAAVCGFRVDGELRRGMVIAGGPASRSFACGALADGTYGAYVRLAFRETRVRNRRHWNASAIPPEEVTVLQATRISEDWDFILDRGNPGPEWLKVGSYTVAGGSATPTLLGTVRAQKFFDSNVGNRNLSNDDWGSTDDRDETAVEANNPNAIKGLRRWALMVMRQLQDIIDTDFYGFDPKSGDTDGTGPRSLTQLNDEKLGRSGEQPMAGLLLPDANETRDVGAIGARFRDLFIRGLNFTGNLVSAATGVNFLTLSGGEALSANHGQVVNTPNGGPGGNTAETVLRAGTAGTGRVVLRAAEILFDPSTRVELDNRRMRFTNVGNGAGEANPAASEAIRNELSAKSINKAIAIISSDGAGNFTIEPDSLNIASVAWQGGTSALRITFAQPMLTNVYGWSAGFRDGGGSNPVRHFSAPVMVTTHIDIQQYVVSGGVSSIVNFSTDPNGGHLSVMVFGAQ